MPHPPVWAWLNIILSLDGKSQQDVQFGEIHQSLVGRSGWRLPVVACRIDVPAIWALCSDASQAKEGLQAECIHGVSQQTLK
ncbi:hypothetical protein P171DRAFT_431073 [Karstenula rhodostoma CBS 690.94]|uniref:Uncharacterized protein n=1 Tax=Karstenula rhodostoma CBS 690.94 TaxID=1392251 RepID=A0A9P4PIG9_9PLEO|nr:hypothetical protein P171DRAFT_431073 [Karstenula rhodostoma CBS 690.94]